MKLRNWFWTVLTICFAISVAILVRGHQVEEGQKAFDRLGCAGCHLAGGAPSLEHVGRKYDRATFAEFVSNPETIYARRGSKPLNPGYTMMPRQEVSHRDVVMLSYFLSAQE